MMTLTVTEAVMGNVIVLKAEGFIDASTCADLEKAIEKLVKENKFKIVIDLSGVEFISSAGWGIFMAFLKKIRAAGGDLRIASMVEKVEKVYRLMEFDSFFDSFVSAYEAVLSFE